MTVPITEADWIAEAGGRMLRYQGPPQQGDFDRQQVAKLVRRKGAWGARWTYDPDYAPEGPWYRLICDIPGYDLDKVPGKSARKCVRRCLRACEIRPVEYPWLAEHGYAVYVNAAARYRLFTPLSREAFLRRMLAHADEPGRAAMGVFHGPQLTAYATLRIRGSTVSILSSQFDPAFSKDYPMYGLHFAIAQEYLGRQGLAEIDSGTRALVHQTDIADFLVRLGWRRQPCRLGLYLVGWLPVVLRVSAPLEPVLRLLAPGAAAGVKALRRATWFARQTAVEAAGEPTAC